jgi:hypothetical protein
MVAHGREGYRHRWWGPNKRAKVCMSTVKDHTATTQLHARIAIMAEIKLNVVLVPSPKRCVLCVGGATQRQQKKWAGDGGTESPPLNKSKSVQEGGQGREGRRVSPHRIRAPSAPPAVPLWS